MVRPRLGRLAPTGVDPFCRSRGTNTEIIAVVDQRFDRREVLQLCGLENRVRHDGLVAVAGSVSL